jgi:hypothetical protein
LVERLVERIFSIAWAAFMRLKFPLLVNIPDDFCLYNFAGDPMGGIIIDFDVECLT